MTSMEKVLESDPVSHVARDHHLKCSQHPCVWGRDGFRGDRSIADVQNHAEKLANRSPDPVHPPPRLLMKYCMRLAYLHTRR